MRSVDSAVKKNTKGTTTTTFLKSVSQYHKRGRNGGNIKGGQKFSGSTLHKTTEANIMGVDVCI